MGLEEILPYLPYLTIASFIISIAVVIFKVGKWVQKIENDMEEIKKKIDSLPSDFWSKFIDAYKMLESVKENPKATKKEKLEDE